MELIDPFGPNAPAMAPQAMPQQPAGLIDPFGKPQAELRSGPPRAPGAPLGRATPIDDPSQAAGFGATMTASLMADPEKQIQVYAKARGLEPERYGIDKEGNIFFIDRDGQTKLEIPSMSGATGVMDFIKRLGQNTGANARSVAAQIAAAGTGAVTAPAAPWLSIPAAGAAAGAVDAGAQALGNQITGQEGINWGSSAKEGALGMGGQALTVGIDKLVTRNALNATPKDIQTLKNPQNYTQYQQTDDLLNRQGITGTPGEITGARSLLARQRQLGRFDETATTMDDFYRMRSERQVPTAFDRTMQRISPVASPAEGARNLQRGADETISSFRRARINTAKPLYAMVDDPANMVPADKFKVVLDDAFTANAIKDVKANKLYAMEGLPDNSLPVIDATKRQLDDMIGAAKRAGENNKVRLLTQKRDTLVSVADDAFPEYAKARAAYAGKSPDVDALEKGIVGVTAKDRTAGMQNIPKTMFDISSADPLSVSTARNAFANAGRMDEWNDGLRAHLTNMFTTAQKNENVAQSFYKAAYADPKRQALLKAAMSPEQFTAFDEFMKALDVVRKSLPEGSPTATDMGGKAAFAGPGARTFGRIPRAGSPQNWGDNLSEFIMSKSADKNAERIANIITQPGAIVELKKLRMMSPTSKKGLALLDNIIVNYGASAANLRDFPEREPTFGVAP